MERNLVVVPLDEPVHAVLKTTTLDKIEMKSIVWLDKPLIPDGAFTLVSGPKGVGKGTWLAGQIARMTTGYWGQPGHVLVISTEDSTSVDLKPRCFLAGAEMPLVHIIQERFTLPHDNGRLYRTAEECGARMVIIDPLANHMNGANSDSESQVRHAVEGLNRLADKLGVAVLGVRHIGKSRERGALGSVLGSTAWVDLPRSVLMFAPDDQDSSIFHVHVVAGNRTDKSQAGRRYQIVAENPEGLDEPVTRAALLGDSTKDIEDLLQANPRRGGSKSQVAREAILDLLDAEGELESDALDARVAALAGVAAKTVQNLRSELRNDGLVKARPDDSGDKRRWMTYRTQAPR